MSTLPEGFEGIIITGGQPFEQRLPIGFEGIVLTFSDITVFFTVTNGLGKPISGMEVTATYGAVAHSGFTDSQGRVNLDILDNTATIHFQKEKTFRKLDFNRTEMGNIVNYVFLVPMME